MAATLLIVDDEETILKQLEWAFKKEYAIVTAQSVDEALAAVRSKSPSLMILDLSLTGEADNLEGFQVLESALQMDPRLKVIVMTGHDDRENALKALETGAVDFYSKPANIDELRVILKRALYIRRLETELVALKTNFHDGLEFEGLIAMSEPMLNVFNTVRKVASADVSVLVTGESGTGKELIARAIHKRSTRNAGPFIPINCGAIPENLLESELFGHEKGSFTGADSSKPGKFEIADGGTLFLDEIGELPSPLQVKLLRFLQDHVIERVGGQKQIQVDVRIIAATNRDLQEMIDRRAFREDLYYRINTIKIFLPPLRERGEDILLLGLRFLHHYAREFSRNIMDFSRSAQNTMFSYSWPGNVRELENRVKRAVIMASGTIIQPDDLDLPAGPVPAPAETGAPADESRPMAMTLESVTLKGARDELERRMVLMALLRSTGNVSAAAQELDISRPTLHDLMNRHNIDPEDFRSAGRKKKG